MTELDRLPTGAEITAAANERRAKELGLPLAKPKPKKKPKKKRRK